MAEDNISRFSHKEKTEGQINSEVENVRNQ